MLQCSIFCKDYHVLDYSKTLKSFAQAWMEESLKGIFITGLTELFKKIFTTL